MKLLLDTHIWVWALERPERLSKKVSRALEDARSEIWLSPISLWEVHLLIERRKLLLKRGADPVRWIEEALAKGSLKEAALTHQVALSSRTIRLEHDDPADRFLAATALVYDLLLVTADERLLRGRGFRTLAN